LKDHFSSGTIKEIKSLFLISKSNCAFVNYSTNAACIFAEEKFNHTMFQGIRLVCRRRGNSNSMLTSSTGSSSIASGVSSSSLPHQLPAPDISDDQLTDQNPEEDKSIDATKGPDRFFILKSLTVQDLEQCVRQGVWTTQAQNERLLNSAYEVGTDAPSLMQ
jgi:YT521-B-like domain